MSTIANTTTSSPPRRPASPLDDEKDVKLSCEHVEASTDVNTVQLHAEADWVRGLTDEEFELHNRRLVRKVSRMRD